MSQSSPGARSAGTPLYPPPPAGPWPGRLALLAAAALAAMWLFSSLSKWGVPKAADLYGVIRDVFPWIPARLAEGFALGLPKAELLLCGGLLLPWSRRWAGAASLLLLGGFTVFLVQAWLTGYQNSCGCFGEVEIMTPSQARRVYGLAVLRNAGLLALAGMVFRRQPAR